MTTRFYVDHPSGVRVLIHENPPEPSPPPREPWTEIIDLLASLGAHDQQGEIAHAVRRERRCAEWSAWFYARAVDLILAEQYPAELVRALVFQDTPLSDMLVPREYFQPVTKP